MQITTKGYSLKFIQTHPVSTSDKTCHLKTYVFKFFSTQNKLHYIVWAEHHELDFFAVKFYAKKDRGSDKKFHNITNKGDVSAILVTSAKVIPYILQLFPKASFGFVGSRTIDMRSKTVEDYSNNQRFRLYKYHIPQLIGSKTFKHVSYEKGSAYGLINKKHSNVKHIENEIRNLLIRDYPDLGRINLN